MRHSFNLRCICVTHPAFTYTLDDLVLEYVGEVIDKQTKDDRLSEWSKEHPNDPNFYIMELQPGWFIDARLLGNMSRFINHSCDPNCKLSVSLL